MNATTLDAATSVGLLEQLEEQPADALLALIGAFRDDPRGDKIDVGVGVYRAPDGSTPVLRAVKAAERRLLEEQRTKSYLGPEGDVGFVDGLKPIVFGDPDMGDRLCGVQTPGGTGALRLAAELIARARHGARMWVGTPTWPNHLPIMKSAGIDIVEYPYFDVPTQRIDFDAMLDAMRRAAPGDVALLHGCCHNPTGADLDDDQWLTLGRLLRERGVVPLVDLAYQGLGRGLDEDAGGLRALLDIVGQGLVAYSCDKNFGLYRERVGALYVLGSSGREAAVVRSNLMSLARAAWSMPPDHGAAVVRVILEDRALAADWRAELTEMRERIRGVRALLAAEPALASLARQHGMFSTLPLTPAEVARLRAERGIYMPASGRINIAGLTSATVPDFIDALASLR